MRLASDRPPFSCDPHGASVISASCSGCNSPAKAMNAACRSPSVMAVPGSSRRSFEYTDASIALQPVCEAAAYSGSSSTDTTFSRTPGMASGCRSRPETLRAACPYSASGRASSMLTAPCSTSLPQRGAVATFSAMISTRLPRFGATNSFNTPGYARYRGSMSISGRSLEMRSTSRWTR